MNETSIFVNKFYNQIEKIAAKIDEYKNSTFGRFQTKFICSKCKSELNKLKEIGTNDQSNLFNY